MREREGRDEERDLRREGERNERDMRRKSEKRDGSDLTDVIFYN